jgi:signal transduction histidine kinase
LLEQILPENTRFLDFKLNSVFPKIGLRRLVLNARRLEWEGDVPGMILLAMEDLTERELTTEALQQSRERLSRLTAGLITAQEEERKRIARDLHDDLNQRLAMLTVELETLERNPPRSREFMRRLESVRLRIATISDDIRQTAHQLHPSTVDHLGLSAAMRSLCADVAKRENIQVHCRERNVHTEVPPDIALCLYRVAQEAIHNVVKHSGARHVSNSLMNGQNRILLSIRDAGRGFDRELNRPNKGLGIVNMEERAHLVGGTLSIRSRPGKGTRVVLEVPLAKDAP